MTRALGDFWAKNNPDLPSEQQIISNQFEICSLERTEPCVLVLASDGVWDVLSEEQVGDFLRSRLQDRDTTPELLTEIATQLCDHCLVDKDSNDNISAALVDIQPQARKLLFEN